jgi:hypothetical protein
MPARLHELEYFPTINQMDRAFSDSAGNKVISSQQQGQYVTARNSA